MAGPAGAKQGAPALPSSSDARPQVLVLQEAGSAGAERGAPALPSSSDARPQVLVLDEVERHNRLGRRCSLVAGSAGGHAGARVEVVFQACEGRVSEEELARLTGLLPVGGALTRGRFDYTLRCVVGLREPLPSRAGAAVFQAVGLLTVERRPRQGLGASVVDAMDVPPPSPGPWPRPNVALDGSAAHALESLAAKAERHRLFADWLLREFGGAEGLAGGDRGQEGGFVLEVAGGRGTLAEELSARGVPVTVVDPRCGPEESAKTRAAPVRFVRAAFEDDCAVRLAERASAVVAMHPDEATEATVDAALAAARPFAVVPCCVFPRLFPARRLRSGQGVGGYAGLLRYLREKEPRIRAARLRFEGRSVVLFMTRRDYDSGSHPGGREPGPLRAPLVGAGQLGGPRAEEGGARTAAAPEEC